MSRHGVAVALALVLSVSLVGSGAAAARVTGALAERTEQPSIATAAVPTLAQLIGQKLVIRMSGTTPSADLLGRIERGEIGGVIVFGYNVVDSTQLQALTAQLQAAAATGGQPRLLIAVDQEGGSVRHIPWAPPTMSAKQMGIDGRTSVALAQGTAAGAALHGLGLNVDFAPVADVPLHSTSFMYQAGRTFSIYPTKTSRLANAFATGLEIDGHRTDDEAFPGHRANALQHRSVHRHLRRIQVDAGVRPHPIHDRHRRPHPADHAVECDVHGIRQRQCGRLVTCDLDRPVARSARVHGRQHHRLAHRDFQGARHRDVAPRCPGGARGNGHEFS